MELMAFFPTRHAGEILLIFVQLLTPLLRCLGVTGISGDGGVGGRPLILACGYETTCGSLVYFTVGARQRHLLSKITSSSLRCLLKG